MKNLGLVLRTFACIALLSQSSPGQLFVENFSYSAGANVFGLGGWLEYDANFPQGGSDSIAVGSGLSYPGYLLDAIGNAAEASNNNATCKDVYHSFTAKTSGSVYVSFMVNVSAATATGDFFFGLGEQNNPVNHALVLAQTDGPKVAFGLQTSPDDTPDYTTFSFNFNQTYLFVLKYKILSGLPPDDSVSLYIFSSGVPSSEPGPPTLGPKMEPVEDLTNVGSVLIIQGAPASAPSVRVDGIRVGTTWGSAPLPVELINLAAAVNRLDVNLRWSTASETNNYGFEIERRMVGDQLLAASWQNVGFVKGAGTSAAPREYTFVDAGLAPGRYAYRIKQTDQEGTFRYFSASEVEVGFAPKALALESNYPNPFNPTTKIEFTVPENGHTTLTIHNILGQQVAVLFNGTAEAGRIYQREFDASTLPTGLYFSRLQFSGETVMRKMMFLK